MNETLEQAGMPAPVETADENAELNPTPATAADGEAEQPKQEERRFTQAELDAAIQKRLLKEERRVHRRVEQQLRERAQQQTAAVEPRREAFQDDEQYLTAHIEHVAAQKAERLLQERERQREAEQRNEAFMAKAEAVSERFADFEQVVGNPSLHITDGMAEFIADSDVGAELAYHLGKNPLKASQIAQMSPFKAARELARIEGELTSKPKPKVSNAPEPITPVGRGRATSSSLPSDSDDIESWMRKERARISSR